ncbi:hypothetical protein AB0E75_15025 [Streptomyces griseoviridis]|uniref:Uncharacterized protein n=1 Tax=Streptomyces griseoviridis TaxID=45398 RepID=A0A918LFH4_STRGD|nr:hypothetical protein [Streptomyces niveoruber]GGS40239.1 hypothetical protein GCM10010238_32250 [Streptomyces niveoruber]
MNAVGGRAPCSGSTRRRSRAPRRLALAVRWAGRALCWSLAAAMASAAADLVLAPGTPWWPAVWPLPWYLTGASALAWAVPRAREKAARRPPDEEDLPAGWDKAA